MYFQAYTTRKLIHLSTEKSKRLMQYLRYFFYQDEFGFCFKFLQFIFFKQSLSCKKESKLKNLMLV